MPRPQGTIWKPAHYQGAKLRISRRRIREDAIRSLDAERRAPTADPAPIAPNRWRRSGFRNRLGRTSWVAGAMIVAQAVLRWQVATPGFFTQDDFVFQGIAATAPLGVEYLFRPHAGHLMPGGFLIVWLLARYAPLEYAPAVATTLGFQILGGIALYLLLRRLFRSPALILFPLGFYLFSPMTLPTFTWWAPALNQVPMQACSALCLLLHTRYLETGSLRWAMATAAGLASGLMFFEKAALVFPLLVGFTWVVRQSWGSKGRLLGVLSSDWKVWTLYGSVVLTYSWFYLLHVGWVESELPSVQAVANLTMVALRTTLVPGLFGGPVTWARIGETGAVAGPSLAVQISSIAALGAMIMQSLRRGGAARRAWLVLLGYVAAQLALISLARLSAVGSMIGTEYRYFADLSLVLAVMLPLAFAPARLGRKCGPSSRDVCMSTTRSRVVTAAAVGSFSIAALWGTAEWSRFWGESTPRSYIENAAGDLADASKEMPLLDQPVPDSVVWRLAYPYNNARYVFAPLRDRPRLGDFSERLTAFALDGHLVPAAIEGVSSYQGPDGECGWRIPPAGREVPLQEALRPGSWVARILYRAVEDQDLLVSLGGDKRTAQIRAAANQVYVLANGSGASLHLRPSAGSSVCVHRVEVGARSIDVATERP